jgi:hypothetical protein
MARDCVLIYCKVDASSISNSVERFGFGAGDRVMVTCIQLNCQVFLHFGKVFYSYKIK